MVKNHPASAGDAKDAGLIPGLVPWRRKWRPTPVLPGEFHGQGSLAGCSPWSLKELDTPEHTQTGLITFNVSPEYGLLFSSSLYINQHSIYFQLV